VSYYNDSRCWPTAEFGVCDFDVSHATTKNLVSTVQSIWEIKEQWRSCDLYSDITSNLQTNTVNVGKLRYEIQQPPTLIQVIRVSQAYCLECALDLTITLCNIWYPTAVMTYILETILVWSLLSISTDQFWCQQHNLPKHIRFDNPKDRLYIYFLKFFFCCKILNSTLPSYIDPA
jgi:hypothetical protein